ncbi:eCIS core domain-containing protein [Streptomyces sp. 6N223]|uniref:eCIS core domain-containing protein n=1 Tax=Streptomyces sp. 6N223 TaxID=3457412 RepID=UPI003FD0CBC3
MRQPAEEEAGAAVPVQRSLVHEVLSSAGRPLDPSVRRDLEPRMGWDFSGVRVHDDDTAARSAEEVGAAAYTSGDHVVVGRGGMTRHLWAHELSHVMQQRSGAVEGTDRGDGVNVSHPTDRSERMAEANASWVLSTEAPAAASAPAVQRTAAHGSPATHAVQRARTGQVMSPAAFREATSSRVPRGTSRITEVDQALEAFHAITSEGKESRAEKIAALRAIAQACRAYLASPRTSRWRGSRGGGRPPWRT